MRIQTIAEYKRQGYSTDQLAEIREGLEHGVDVSVYADKEYFAIQMRQIRLGLEKGIDVSLYASKSFDWFQMEEIRLGLESGLDASVYAKPEYSYEVMRQLRKALADHIHLEKYAAVSADLLRELHHAILDKQDIMPYIKEGYVPEQLSEIRHALNKGCHIEKYLNKSFRGPAIREIWKGLAEGLDVTVYTDPEYNWHQMREIRLGLEKRIDVSIYAKVLYSPDQMREIRLGLEEKLDIDSYKSMMYSPADMKRKRLALLKEKESSPKVSRISEKDMVAEIPQKMELPRDAFRIMVSEDRMQAYIYAGEDAEVPSMESLRRELARRNIRQGIKKEILEELQDNAHRNKAVLIASGKKPKRGRDGYYEFFFDNVVNKEPQIMKDGSLNYENVVWFTKTYAGQKLAVYHMAEKGEDGYNIEGLVLHGEDGRDQKPLRGRGFKLLSDSFTYISEENGSLILDDNRMVITKLMQVEDASMITGNIEFDGSVLIKGDVKSNILIRATGDVAVEGFMENAFIECGGDIFLKKGVSSNGVGRLVAKGKVCGRFFENISISADEIVSNYFFRCNLSARKNIHVYGKNGSLAGGNAYAGHSIRTMNLGNKAGVETEVYLGITENMENNDLNAQLKETERQLTILNNALEKFKAVYPPEVRNASEAFLKIENAIYTKEMERKKLLDRMERMEAARIAAKQAFLEVKGCLYEGTNIRINDALFSGGTMQRVLLRNSRHCMTITHI